MSKNLSYAANPVKSRRLYKVKSIDWKSHHKIANLGGSKKLIVPRSACVTSGEKVLVKGDEAFVACEGGLVRLLPSYAVQENVDLGSLQLDMVVKEITSLAELEAYQSLANFHYRDQPLFGRTARLIVQNFHPSYPKTIGYIELATPFYMSKSRTEVLDRPFRNGAVSWKSWDKETARKSINMVVRIARCVIYPEFRGVGLGQKLMHHACEFARTRWQVGGVRPQFIEISADMLKYVPFAERAGLHFIGETQGNLGRVANDMRYLLENKRRVKSGLIVKEEAFGIVDQQVARLSRATTIMKQNRWTAAQLVERLKRIEKSASLRDLSLLQHLLSLPKPTYFGGLNAAAENFVKQAVAAIKPTNGFFKETISVDPITAPISVKNLMVTHNSRVRRNKHTAAVQRAFGISPEEINHPIINNLSFDVFPGQIAMIVGPSGSGKTSLLKFLGKISDSRRKANASLQAPKGVRVGVFEPIRSKEPLIQALGINDVSKALRIMGMVSLSDAFVYLKRFDQLSAGQQYRALLAKLISGKSNVWLADEFCVNLDPIAASSVATRMGDLARKLNAILVVATPQPELIVRALKPDIVIRLTTAWEHQVLSGKDFVNHLVPRPSRFKIPTISVDNRTLGHIKRNKVRCLSLVPGERLFQKGPTMAKNSNRIVFINITETRRTALANLATKELRAAGFTSLKHAIQYFRKRDRLFDARTPLTVLSTDVLSHSSY